MDDIRKVLMDVLPHSSSFQSSCIISINADTLSEFWIRIVMIVMFFMISIHVDIPNASLNHNYINISIAMTCIQL